MINLVTEMRDEAQRTLEQSRTTLKMRRQAGLVAGIMTQVAAAKATIKWYQRHNLSCKPARHLVGELQDQLNHHIGANQMLRNRVSESADRVHKLNQALKALQEQCGN